MIESSEWILFLPKLSKEEKSSLWGWCKSPIDLVTWCFRTLYLTFFYYILDRMFPVMSQMFTDGSCGVSLNRLNNLNNID